MLGARGGEVRLLAFVAVISLSTSAYASPAPDPWDGQDLGPKRAAAVIGECLNSARSSPDDDPEDCVNVAFRICENEHGTSQRDLNECAYFSRSAWEARLDKIRARLLGATVHPNGTEDPVPRKRLLSESDRQWIAWNKADCEMQLVDQGGSMLPMLTHLCFSRHAAHRAMELEDLSFWWGKAYGLPE